MDKQEWKAILYIVSAVKYHFVANMKYVTYTTNFKTY